MFTVNYKPSTAHWIFPPIIIGVLIVLLFIMALRRAIKCVRGKKPFVSLKGNIFPAENRDKFKLLGTIALLALYIASMELIGFLGASILCLFLYNLLYTGFPVLKLHKGNTSAIRSIAVSAAISVAASAGVWFLFSRVFKITLP
jgi:hypothetical protein